MQKNTTGSLYYGPLQQHTLIAVAFSLREQAPCKLTSRQWPEHSSNTAMDSPMTALIVPVLSHDPQYLKVLGISFGSWYGMVQQGWERILNICWRWINAEF